ncbi:hypothetical protein [Kineococcus glutinatus]
MSTQPHEGHEHQPGSAEAAEEPAVDGYGNDTGFAEEAEEADPATGGS